MQLLPIVMCSTFQCTGDTSSHKCLWARYKEYWSMFYLFLCRSKVSNGARGKCIFCMSNLSHEEQCRAWFINILFLEHHSLKSDSTFQSPRWNLESSAFRGSDTRQVGFALGEPELNTSNILSQQLVMLHVSLHKIQWALHVAMKLS